MPDTILVVNAGSSSIKFQLFDIVDGASGLDLSLKGRAVQFSPAGCLDRATRVRAGREAA